MRPTLSPAQRRYVLLEQGGGAAVINFALNAGIAWLLFNRLASVPLWGSQSIAGDTIGTCFFLPFLTALIVTPLARMRVRAGKLDAPAWRVESHGLLARLPRGTVRRAAYLGGACALSVAPVTIAILDGLEITALQLWSFIAFKAVFAALLAALVTPLIALYAIAAPELA
jgi:hypothetical protein